PKVVPPSLVSNVPPMANETSVVLSITVKADGTVGAVGIIDSSGYTDLDTAAAESVKRFKFAPATANGKPIDYVLHQTVSYKLGQ
ncbi:MAG: Gram-negative bacterial TonB protein C-terminal, partial [Pseudomonadota bacterium]